MTNTNPPKQSQKSLYPKLVHILPTVSEVENVLLLLLLLLLLLELLLLLLLVLLLLLLLLLLS